MPEPVMDPAYWAERLRSCGGEIHRAIFAGSTDQFSGVQAEQRRVLLREIRPDDFVLDCGCGYGRIIDQMPKKWRGDYVGVDIAEELLQLGRILHLGRRFYRMDLRELTCFSDDQFDVAIVSAVRTMVIRNCGQDEWAKMEQEINRVAKRVLYLTFGEWD